MATHCEQWSPRMADDLLELTRFSHTEIGRDTTTHRIYQPGLQEYRLETWTHVEELGRGSYGVVWREKQEDSRSRVSFRSTSATLLTNAMFYQECELSNRSSSVAIRQYTKERSWH